MSRLVLSTATLALLGVSFLGCCGLFQSDEDRYDKCMECAERITSDLSVDLLKQGRFCCEAVPAGIQGREPARRFYLEKARDLKPDSPEPLAALGRSYWFEGDYSRAADAFGAAAAKSSRPFPYLVALAAMARVSGRYDDALASVARIRTLRGVDAEKTADYLEARVRYEQGQEPEARRLFEASLARASKSGFGLGPSPYSMRDAWFYLAQIRRKSGDPLGAHEAFKSYLSLMNDPEFQLWYAKTLLPEMGSDQTRLYDTVERSWVRERQ